MVYTFSFILEILFVLKDINNSANVTHAQPFLVASVFLFLFVLFVCFNGIEADMQQPQGLDNNYLLDLNVLHRIHFVIGQNRVCFLGSSGSLCMKLFPTLTHLSSCVIKYVSVETIVFFHSCRHTSWDF